MSKIEFINYALFNIDVNNQLALRVLVDNDASDFNDFSEVIIKELLSSSRSKQYKFSDDNELVASHIISIVKFNSKESSEDNEDSWEIRTASIADKLLKEETSAQADIEHLNQTITKGSLLIIHLKDDNIHKFIIIKIDQGDFIDEENGRLRRGLPVSKQRLQKSCLVTISDDGAVMDVLLADSGKAIRKYWWKGFLSTQELVSAEVNTRIAFNAIDNFLRKEVKKESDGDYYYMRNDVISYFRNNENFVYSDLVDRLGSHLVESEKLKQSFPKLIDKLKGLPTKEGAKFDTQFEMESSIIKAKLKSTIILDEKLELRINGDIPNIKKKIIPQKDNDGKYIKIYTDAGYKAFGGEDS
ncbi:TPA: nucleoid-associated protein [Yersinia enterocolitica]|uniref:nucleoid-associated protein n=1 Tax=Yersinia enterocolitica TaxID=630 RepID=UPI0028B58B7E|nr:nucleoid-associated protein [Yersinia enterocolitica]ELI7990148.1 nucleoid-associated protein [Yersinia enterocolitica]